VSGPAFFQTRMGMRHFEHTMPELVRQLTLLNDLIERVVRQVELDRELAGPAVARPSPSNEEGA
jgi:hypothetical protein